MNRWMADGQSDGLMDGSMDRHSLMSSVDSYRRKLRISLSEEEQIMNASVFDVMFFWRRAMVEVPEACRGA